MYKSKKCKLCNSIFLPTSGSQKYCEKCKDIGRNLKNKKRDRVKSRSVNNYTEQTKICTICGVSFNTFYKKKIYCGSEECELKRKRLKNSRAEVRRSYKRKQSRFLEREKLKILKIKESCELFSKHGYTVLSSSGFVNSHNGSFKLLCPNGHVWYSTLHNFKDNNNRCYRCYTENNYNSSIETCLKEYFETNFQDLRIIHNDRSVIGPKEIDLYFPDHKVGVEVCGLYWHSETAMGKDKDYHYKKMMECYEKGVRLITVFEDEINNKFDLVVSRIKQALGLIDKKIYARKCNVKVIDVKTSRDFFNKNHIQGYSSNKISFGLFYKNNLVAACSLGNPTRNNANVGKTLELKRFCCLNDYVVIGAASKLLKQSVNYAINMDYDNIKSYCDMRYANIFNPVYEIIGFNLLSYTKYTPHYFKGGIRYRNMSLRKNDSEKLLNKTELELRLSQGYNRIWDCGHRTYIMEINR